MDHRDVFTIHTHTKTIYASNASHVMLIAWALISDEAFIRQKGAVVEWLEQLGNGTELL